MLNRKQRNTEIFTKAIILVLIYYIVFNSLNYYGIWYNNKKVSKAETIDVYFVNDIVTNRKIVTSEDIFNTMEKEVAKLINSKTEDVNLDNIEINHEIIPMDSYVSVNTDENVMYEKDKIKQSKDFVICDKIYCNNYYIAKYMNESGEFKTFIAEYKDNKIIVYPRDKFDTLINVEYSNYKAGDTISEQEYVDILKQAIIKIYSKDTSISTEIQQLFTEEAFNELISKANDSSTDGIKDKSIEFMVFGKSNLEEAYIDRIYVQVEITTESEKVYSDLEFRLNESGVIFDINTL